MANDVASLGFAIDSSQAITAATALDRLAAAAASLENALKRQGEAAKKTQTDNSALAVVLRNMQSQMTAMAGGLGIVGVGLAALGPVGLGAAVVLKLVGDAIDFVLQESRRMGESSTDLRKFADVIGLSIMQVKALKQAGAELGIGNEIISSSFLRLTAQMTQVGRATGTVFDEVRNLSGALAEEMLGAKDEAERINILAKAYNSATDASIRATIARAAFGRQGMAQGPIFDTIAMAGGIQNLVKVTKEFDGATEAQTRRWDKMSRDIVQTEARTKNIFASIFTEDGLRAAQTAAHLMERLAIAAKSTAEQKEGLSFWQRLFTGMAESSSAGSATSSKIVSDNIILFAAQQRLAKGMGSNLAVDKKDLDSWLQFGDNIRGILLPLERAKKTLEELQRTAIANANLMDARIGALGAAATINEKTQQALLKIEKDRLSNLFSTVEAENNVLATRAKSATLIDARVQKEAIRITQLGDVATVQELVRQKEDALQKAIRDGVAFSPTELATMRARNQLLAESSQLENQMVFDRQQLFKSQADQSIDQILRAAGIPPASDRAAAIRDYMRITDQIKQMNDAGGAFVSGFLTDLSHGVKAIDALKNALKRLSDTLIDMISRKLVTQALGGLAGSFGLGGGNVGDTVGGNLIYSGGALSPLDAAVRHGGGMADFGGSRRYISPAYFDNAPHFARGGIVGGEVPIIAHKGERVSTPEQWAAHGRGGGNTANYYIDASGADPAAISRLQGALLALSRDTNAKFNFVDKHSMAQLQQKRMLEG